MWAKVALGHVRSCDGRIDLDIDGVGFRKRSEGEACARDAGSKLVRVEGIGVVGWP